MSSHHVYPLAEERHHDLDGLDCVCRPKYEIECSQCDGVGAEGCWKCNGTGWATVELEEARAHAVTEDVLVVHNEGCKCKFCGSPEKTSELCRLCLDCEWRKFEEEQRALVYKSNDEKMAKLMSEILFDLALAAVAIYAAYRYAEVFFK